MIRCENLVKSFDRLRVLDDVTFAVRPGAVTAVLGPNASGKSTLIKGMLGLVRPDSGRIFVGDEMILRRWDYRSRIGYMPQIARFPENLAVRELLNMIMDVRGASTPADDELIHSFRLKEIMSRPLRVLSGGTRQKINAAVAFLFDPEILILDEPTAGLDPVSVTILKGKIAREKEGGKTIVLTSHNMHEVEEVADHILFLLDGKACFDGPLVDLKRRTRQAHLEGAILTLLEART